MRSKVVVLFAMLVLILTACGGGNAESTEAAQDASNDTVALSETFSGATSTSGTLSLNYPSGWTTTGTADALGLTNTDAGTGISLSVLPSAATAAMGSSPSEILSDFASNVATASGVTYSEPEEMTFGSNSGAMVSATANGVDSIIAIINVNDAYVFLTHTAPEGNMDDNKALLESVAASVTLE